MQFVTSAEIHLNIKPAAGATDANNGASLSEGLLCALPVEAGSVRLRRPRAAFMDAVDAVVMGRKTFETVLGFDPRPYAGNPMPIGCGRRLFGALPEDRQWTLEALRHRNA